MGSKLTGTGVTFGSTELEQTKPLNKVDGVESDSQGNIEVPITGDLEKRVTDLEDLMDVDRERIYNVFQNRNIITSTYMRENLNGDVNETIANSTDDLGIWSMTLPARDKSYFVKIQLTGAASYKRYESNVSLSEPAANDLLAGGATLVWWGLIPPDWAIDVRMLKNTVHGRYGGSVPGVGNVNINNPMANPTTVYLRPSNITGYPGGGAVAISKYLKADNGYDVNMGYHVDVPEKSGQIGGRTDTSDYLNPNHSSNGDGISNPKGLKVKAFWGYSPNGPVTINQGEYINNLYNGQIWGNVWNYFDPSTWYANLHTFQDPDTFPNPSDVSDGYGKVPINSGIPGDDRHSPPNGEGVVVIEWTPIGE